MKQQDLSALKYAGFLGHRYATVKTQPDGSVRRVGEFNDLANAKRLAGKGERLYRKDENGWQRCRLGR